MTSSQPMPGAPRLVAPRERVRSRVDLLIAEGESLADQLAPVTKAFAALEEIGGGEHLYQARHGDLAEIQDPPEDLAPVVALWREMPKHYASHQTVVRAVDRWRDAGYELLASSFDDPQVAKRFQRAAGPWVAGQMARIDRVRQLERQIEGGVSQLTAIRDSIDFYQQAKDSPRETPARTPSVRQTALTAIIQRVAGWIPIAILLLILVGLIAFGLINPDVLDWFRGRLP